MLGEKFLMVVVWIRPDAVRLVIIHDLFLHTRSEERGAQASEMIEILDELCSDAKAMGDVLPSLFCSGSYLDTWQVESMVRSVGMYEFGSCVETILSLLDRPQVDHRREVRTSKSTLLHMSKQKPKPFMGQKLWLTHCAIPACAADAPGPPTSAQTCLCALPAPC